METIKIRESFNPQFGFARLPDNSLVIWEARGREGSRSLVIDAEIHRVSGNPVGTGGYVKGETILPNAAAYQVEEWLSRHGAVPEECPAEFNAKTDEL